ncbi:MAG: DUF4395 family protein [Acidimicrobiia bacterium]
MASARKRCRSRYLATSACRPRNTDSCPSSRTSIQHHPRDGYGTWSLHEILPRSVVLVGRPAPIREQSHPRSGALPWIPLDSGPPPPPLPPEPPTEPPPSDAPPTEPAGPDHRVVRIEQSTVAVLLAAEFVFDITWLAAVALAVTALALLGPMSPIRLGFEWALRWRKAPTIPVAEPESLRLGQYFQAAALAIATGAWLAGSSGLADLVGLLVMVAAAVGAAFAGWPIPARWLHRR